MSSPQSTKNKEIQKFTLQQGWRSTSKIIMNMNDIQCLCTMNREVQFSQVYDFIAASKPRSFFIGIGQLNLNAFGNGI